MHAMSRTHLVYLGLGANLGDRLAQLRAARARLVPMLALLACSPLYETAPWGLTDQPPFLNAVCLVRTALAPEALLLYLKTLERVLGRQPGRRWGPRAIDLDILLYDDLLLATPTLTIPHPRLHERAFVLEPLAHLAPALRHPRLNEPIARLAQAVDRSGVRLVAAHW